MSVWLGLDHIAFGGVPVKPEEVEATELDLREHLTAFWLHMMDDATGDPQDRMKASELLAKHVLGEGQRKVKASKPGVHPTTAEIMRIADTLDSDGGR